MPPQLSRQLHRKILLQYNTQTVNELFMKDIYWRMTQHPNKRHLFQLQLPLLDLTIIIEHGNKSLHFKFHTGINIKFDIQYFQTHNYSPTKFSSLIFLILDKFGPVQNKTQHVGFLHGRKNVGLYQLFKSQNVLRKSLLKDPIYLTLNHINKL